MFTAYFIRLRWLKALSAQMASQRALIDCLFTVPAVACVVAYLSKPISLIHDLESRAMADKPNKKIYRRIKNEMSDCQTKLATLTQSRREQKCQSIKATELWCRTHVAATSNPSGVLGIDGSTVRDWNLNAFDLI